MIFEVQSGGTTYEVDAPDQETAIRGIQEIIAGAVHGKADRLPMAPGATPHAMPAETVQGGPPVEPPSVGADIASSAASRAQAGVLDVPGIPGDMGSLASDAGGFVADKLLSLFGKSKEQREEARRKANALLQSSRMVSLPGSEDVKRAVGFEAYEPQTEAGQAFDKTIGAGIEMAPGVLAGGGVKTIGKAAGDVAKFAMAPAIAGEAAGQATKGSALEPWARGAAMIAAGGAAGARQGKVTGAKTIDELRASAKAARGEAVAAGVVVKPNAYDNAISDIEIELKNMGFRAALQPKVQATLNELAKDRGTLKTLDDIDELHKVAGMAAKSADPSEAMMGRVIAEKIDDFVENLKPGDLIAGNSKEAFNKWMKYRSDWRKMRTGERIENLMEKARDRVGANYTSAGMQTALRQEFKNFKWKGKVESREYKMLAKEEKAVVNAIIRGVSVENALRLVGKFNIRNPFAVSIMTGMGLTGNAVLGGGLLAAGEVARRVSARGTLAKADRLSEMVRGGKVTPRSRRLTPNSVFYGVAAQRETEPTK